MPWPPDIADQLPAPRDDEPEGLRQDIADELADHLQSAFVRELHATRDEKAAKENVLDRFGNPASIATKLWFDAMWEKIMSHRLTLATSLLAMLASLVSAGVVCIFVGQSRQATNELLEQSREANEALLTKLSALATLATPSDTSVPVRTFDWNPVKVKLVHDNRGGPPAVGLSVSLQGNIYGESGAVSAGMQRIEKKSAANGEVDFGMVRNGRYYLQVTTAFHQPNRTSVSRWNATGSTGMFRGAQSDISEYTQRDLDIRPGSDSVIEIVCPSEPLPAVSTSLEVEWPDDLRDKEIWLVCDFVDIQSNREIGGTVWTTSQHSALSQNYNSPDSQLARGASLIISPAGKFVASTIYVGNLFVDGDTLVSDFENAAAVQRIELLPRAELQCGWYRVVRIAAAEKADDGQRTRLRLINQPFAYHEAAAAYRAAAIANTGGGVFAGGFNGGSIAPAAAMIERNGPQFELKPVASSVLKIVVPEELAESILATLPTGKQFD